VARRVDPPDSKDVQWRRWHAFYALARRGHLGEAFWMIRSIPGSGAAQLALFGAVPAESAAARFSGPGAAGGLAWWAGRRDTQALRAAIRSFHSSAGSDPLLRRAHTAAYDLARAQAYLALARGDTTEAIRRFVPLIDSLCPGCSWSRLFTDIYVAAQLLYSRGRDREAERWLDYDAITVPHAVFDVALALLRGRVAERLGKQEKAGAAYRFVAASWAHGDPQLQVYVTEARTALRRLGANPRR